MRKYKKRKLREGDTISCHDKCEMLNSMARLSAMGVDVKPTGIPNQLVICGFDERKKCR